MDRLLTSAVPVALLETVCMWNKVSDQTTTMIIGIGRYSKFCQSVSRSHLCRVWWAFKRGRRYRVRVVGTGGVLTFGNSPGAQFS